MAGPIFFAWVGGPLVPAFEVLASGDLWGGSVSVLGSVWGGSLTTLGDVDRNTGTISNITNPNGLRVGHQYTITGDGLATSADGVSADTVMTYSGSGQVGGGSTGQITKAGVAVSLTLTNEADRSSVVLNDTSQLESGSEYGISGGGLVQGTTFVFAGEDTVAISLPATATGVVPLQITRLSGRDVVKNLTGDLSGLIEGQPYDLFGLGLPAGTTGVWDGAISLTLSAEATVTGAGVTILISKPASFPDGGAFDPEVHAREDEDVFSLQLDHTEGNFATLNVILKNPGVGVLGIARSLWCWVSWFDGAGIVPLFHGRLVGVPQALQGETVTLSFVARPEDYETQKNTLAAALRSGPCWDPAWLAEGAGNPDTVLEARTLLWHPDRLTLALSASDIIAGEDGTLVVGEDDHFYDGLAVSYAAPPLRRVNFTATATWNQLGEGDVDLTDAVFKAFKGATFTDNSRLYDPAHPPTEVGGVIVNDAPKAKIAYPTVWTFTGDGFKSAWPAPGTAIGGGWSVGELASITDAVWVKGGRYAVRFQGKNPNAGPRQLQIPTPFNTTNPGAHILTTFDNVTIPNPADVITNGSITYDVLFDMSGFKIHLPVHYSASRARTEIVAFSLEADVQSVMTEAGVTENETIALSSAFIDQPVDPGGAMPIGDLRRNAYFPTDRGIRSVEFFMMLARAKILSRARAVIVKFVTTWQIAASLSCRWSVELHDRRLPGGSATGKVTGLVLSLTGAGNFSAEVTLGCTVGHGGTVEAADGVGVYADDVFEPGVQQEKGGQVELVAGELAYQALDNIAVIDDDGVDLFNPTRLIYPPVVLGGIAQQKAAIDSVATAFFPGLDQKVISNNPDGSLTIPSGASLFPGKVFPITPVEALALTPTRVALLMQPVTGGAFQSSFYVLTSKLAVPKTIDLEA